MKKRKSAKTIGPTRTAQTELQQQVQTPFAAEAGPFLVDVRAAAKLLPPQSRTIQP